MVLGLLYGVAQILQTAGLAHTPASVSGFITGMYVVCTPLFAALLLRTRIGAGHLGAPSRSRLAGLGVLTLNGLSRRATARRSRSCAALLYALHIVGLGAWSDARPGARHGDRAAAGDHAWSALVATAPGRRRAADHAGDWLSVVYMAVFAGALAMARPDLGAGAPAADPHARSS